MARGLKTLEALDPARIEHDGADGIGLARVLRAVVALLPRRPDTADEIERGIEPVRQSYRDFALAQIRAGAR